MTEDPSYGYEAITDKFVAARSTSGRSIVQKWAASLPSESSVIDIGAGHGEPLTSVLINKGFLVWAIDASPAMVAAFRQRFPGIEVACEAAERSSFFGRTFDAALAIGLIFLLPEDGQRALIHRISDALKPGGSVLLSAPWQVCTWKDVLTDQISSSLGAEKYGQIFSEAGFRVSDMYVDECGTHYYEAQRI